MRLSILDRSRTRAGHPDADGLTDSVDRAVRAEQLGYDRFWVAEHHAVPGIASGSPAVLLAAIGAVTDRIRLGSGGVMLPHHQPLVVAEQFLMLAALHPGRIDLGLGRSLGFTAPVREALHDDRRDTFEHDLSDLRAHLDGDAAVTARPRSKGRIPMYVLATRRGSAIAARLGLPVVIGGPILADPAVGGLLQTYRRNFRPSLGVAEPYVMVSLDATVAETDDAARELALPEAWAMARSRQTGEFPPLESPEDIRGQAWTTQARARIAASLDSAIAGSHRTVQRALEQLAERTGADELLASTSTYDREALLESDRLLREIVEA
ncbi:LLM class flavin-dependent oxidoreductase [Aeromicrobium sp. A1-2]|uniref:LLM class flavin-dependent oxidoreductase n=1 Tax=Aeromicrobium sp. A1-2 TaxID=2107713 RepID=UPI000E4763AF|nr:LLM class flavin-dependent oxidoreductase [Aeromicrobium sp. A1-2]AXT85893.1 LLM class flavin-dependent oxidoreductase [Aeromicrobium sp. A1-2]